MKEWGYLAALALTIAVHMWTAARFTGRMQATLDSLKDAVLSLRDEIAEMRDRQDSHAERITRVETKLEVSDARRHAPTYKVGTS